jgi:multisubunit Na+/H+ antiporter MnhE subunit
VRSQDDWTGDILVAGLGVAAGFVASFTMARASVGSFSVAGIVLELVVAFVVLHYVRRLAQKLPYIGDLFVPVFYVIQFFAMLVASAGMAINLLH